MDSYIKRLGKVAITAEGEWESSKAYDKLCLVTLHDDHNVLIGSYISKKPVPLGILVNNPEYWQEINTKTVQFNKLITPEIIDDLIAGRDVQKYLDDINAD